MDEERRIVADLSLAEWTLVLELVERELRELPVEIHHTATVEYKKGLRERMDRVEGLVARLRPLVSRAA